LLGAFVGMGGYADFAAAAGAGAPKGNLLGAFVGIGG
jgi:hypothetical protein